MASVWDVGIQSRQPYYGAHALAWDPGSQQGRAVSEAICTSHLPSSGPSFGLPRTPCCDPFMHYTLDQRRNPCLIESPRWASSSQVQDSCPGCEIHRPQFKPWLQLSLPVWFGARCAVRLNTFCSQNLEFSSPGSVYSFFLRMNQHSDQMSPPRRGLPCPSHLR